MSASDDGPEVRFARVTGDMPVIHNAEPVVEALERIWVIVRRDGLERVTAQGLRGALRDVTVEARAANILPEQMLWLLKSSWRGLPEVRKVERPEVASDLLDRMVTLCIEEYFA